MMRNGAMKSRVSTTWGHGVLLAVLGMAAVLLMPASPGIAQTAKPAKFDASKLGGAPMPDILLSVRLLKNSLAALNNANLTSDYSVFRKLASTSFQKKNSEKQLAKTFKWYSDNRIDLSAVAILKPVLPQRPTLSGDGTLRMAGQFPSSPLSIQFSVAYRPEQKVWKLDGISLKAVPTARRKK